MGNQINYKQKIEQSLPLINEWIENQQEEIKQTEEYQEFVRVINEIQKEKDYSKQAYEDIRYLLRLLNEKLPLQIKRMFDISTLDNYCAFISSRHFCCIDDFINLEMCTSKFNGNMKKFFYNPIPLTPTTRP